MRHQSHLGTKEPCTHNHTHTFTPRSNLAQPVHLLESFLHARKQDNQEDTDMGTGQYAQEHHTDINLSSARDQIQPRPVKQ